MSVVTAEVKVDRKLNITNLRNGQPAEVTIDAVPVQRCFKATSPMSANLRFCALPVKRP